MARLARRARWCIALVGVLVLVVVPILQLCDASAESLALERPREARESGDLAVAVLAPPEETARTERSRADSEIEHASLLRVEVHDVAGAAAVGRIYWVSTTDAPASAHPLSPGIGVHSGGPEMQTRPFRGSVECRLPRETWTWLRVVRSTGIGSEAPEQIYRLVAPFSGVHHERVQFGSANCGVHVFVLNGRLEGPARGSAVRAFSTSRRRGPAPVLLRSQKADAHGYAWFRDLDPRAYVFCAGGSEPGNSDPHSRTVVLGRGVGSMEAAITLVAPEPTRAVRLAVRVSGPVQKRPRPKLFLAGVEERAGSLLPFPGTLKEGTQVLTLRVPPGEYELGVMPIGSLRLTSLGRRLHVSRDRDLGASVALDPPGETCHLELIGVPTLDFPLRVVPRPVGRVLGGREDLYYLGPYSWRSLEQDIPPLDEPHKLVVIGRRGSFWISLAPVPRLVGRVLVHCTSASRVEVHWHGKELRGLRGALVELSGGGECELLALRPELVGMRGMPVPTLVGSLVVPQGRYTLRGILSDGRTIAWTREVIADRAYRLVEVEVDR